MALEKTRAVTALVPPAFSLSPHGVEELRFLQVVRLNFSAGSLLMMWSTQINELPSPRLRVETCDGAYPWNGISC